VDWGYCLRCCRRRRPAKGSRKKESKGDVEKGLKDAESGAKLDASPEAINSGSSMPMGRGTARRTRSQESDFAH
jgi:hypothetical protein